MSVLKGKRVIPIASAPGSGATAEQVSLYVSEDKIYARAVHGRFALMRVAMVALTQLVFYGLPWLQWGQGELLRQAVLFDLGARRFFIFGLVLHPQDFIYLTALLVICAYALFLFTAVFGRVWCGYACPQTVYTEIFMWVERHTEGDRVARMRLDAAPWSLNKIGRKAAKQFIWVAIGLWTGFTFVGYFTPIHELGAEMLAVFGLGSAATPGPWESFWVLFYGFATYGNGGYMREQVCKYMCPYARFQSAMFDHDTLVIGYDAKRGEPRGSRPKSVGHAGLAAAGKGECVDCTLCVQVCPTGIDIRKGLQYECIGCAACIDVCDSVMDKMNYPRGLIRYDTQNGQAAGWTRAQLLKRVLRPRVLVYSVILLGIVGAFVVTLGLRSSFRVDVVRDRGVLARQVEEGRVENVYRLQVMNTTEHPLRLRIGVDGLHGAAVVGTSTVDVAPTEARWVAVSVQLPADAAHVLTPSAQPIRFRVDSVPTPGASAETVTEKSTFMVPR